MANFVDLHSKSNVKKQISKKSEASVVARQIPRCALLGICIEAILIASALQTECTFLKIAMHCAYERHLECKRTCGVLLSPRHPAPLSNPGAKYPDLSQRCVQKQAAVGEFFENVHALRMIPEHALCRA